ncbi:hypothetical protein VTN00DRAFT_7929 [Thermoascus crustaceus]|uniref:uncharacterized protein n=1 Tax=Thermoascus crustaceus TaxID=5088 RepID=UPI003742229A
MPKRTTPGDEEAFSRLRDRWHLEQRTMSKVAVVAVESEDERGGDATICANPAVASLTAGRVVIQQTLCSSAARARGSSSPDNLFVSSQERWPSSSIR